MSGVRIPSAPGTGAAWLLAVVLTALGGCGTVPDSSGVGSVGAAIETAAESSPWADPAQLDPSPHATGPFGKMLALDLADGVRTGVSGWIDSPGEVMTYNIGPLFPGDKLLVEVIAEAEGFDPAVAVFDADENLLHLNDDRHFYDRQLNPLVEFVSREYSAQCYVVVSSSVRAESTGAYDLYVTRTPDASYASPGGQIVYLNFQGQDRVIIGRRRPVDVPPFSGEMIALEFASRTEELIRRTVQRVRGDYAGYDVTILSSNEQPPPATPHSTVYFGSYNSSLLGIADSVDSFNERRVQEAVIFVDTFSVFMSQEPTVEEISDALANVASHEIGHLLGLHHTADAEAIMDTTASLRQMLRPQAFQRSPLNGDTFVVGHQDSPRMLLWNVGGDEAAIQAAGRARRAKLRDPWYDAGPRRAARSFLQFGTGCAGP